MLFRNDFSIMQYPIALCMLNLERFFRHSKTYHAET